MPGILPMKIIKMSSSTQTRIAQACDRCRSKKIRCDGVRPCCTQCSNVGFECKTSDKLSRRAFPRGYTESLEEQVRILEAEVRELKILLDGTEEKIELLSRVRSNSPSNSSKRSVDASLSPNTTIESSIESQDHDTETLKLLQSPTLISCEESDSYFMGMSSSRAIIDAFKSKIQQSPRHSIELNTDAYLSTVANKKSNSKEVIWKAPPRMVSDQLVNIFFQEWAPLFPILHRHTFLSIYRQYVAQPEKMEDKKSLAQLHLVFGIAAQSVKSSLSTDLESIETQWKAALESILGNNSLATLQCLALAQIYCLQKGDYSLLLKYRGFAAGLSQYLGLHQSQKDFTLGILTRETRKRVFWSLYTLDCFSAARLGQPLIFSDSDIQCEYPVDVDDEYINENEILPNLSGEFTKLSSALALFELARIVSKIIKQIYFGSNGNEVSTKKITSLQEELDKWSNQLPTHLKLQFEKDKPSTGIISSRSPLLSLAYYYVHTLILRPAILATSPLESPPQSSMVSLASSSKRIVQIIQLLEERNMSFSFCLNRNEILMLAGFGLLFQLVDLDQKSRVFKDNADLIHDVVTLLHPSKSAISLEFRKTSKTIIMDLTQESNSQQKQKTKSTKATRGEKSSIAKHPLKVLASRLASPTNKSTPNLLSSCRRATISEWNSPSQISLISTNSDSHDLFSTNHNLHSFSRSEPNQSPVLLRSSFSPPNQASQISSEDSWPNLDFLPFGASPVDSIQMSLPMSSPVNGPRDWERFVSDIDNGESTIHENIYGGNTSTTTMDANLPVLSKTDLIENSIWSPFESWANDPDLKSTQNNIPQSVLSFGSDETLTSCEDWIDISGQQTTTNGPINESFAAIIIPNLEESSGDGNGLRNVNHFGFT